MSSGRKPTWLSWLRALFRPPDEAAPEMRQARELIRAVDAGGVPLNPARINAIARNLGLEVSRKAPVEDTIRRIRAAVGRG